MIERVVDRRDRLLDVAVVDEIALRWIHFAFDHDFHAERMPMHATALVAIGEAREKVGGFEGETLGEGDAHRAESVGGKGGRKNTTDRRSGRLGVIGVSKFNSARRTDVSRTELPRRKSLRTLPRELSLRRASGRGADRADDGSCRSGRGGRRASRDEHRHGGELRPSPSVAS